MRVMKKWNAELNVGIGLIDNQHKIIFDLVNDLGRASEAMADKKVIDTLFDVIENYVFRHFEAEEELFRHHQEAQEHSLEHYALIKEFRKFRLSFRNKSNAESTVHDFLDAWFVEHITQRDIPLFESIARGGVEELHAAVDEYPFEQKERRRHKRIQHKKITDADIEASCYNTSTLRNSKATVLDVSLGGVRIDSGERFAVGDLLIVSCNIGRNFKMKEKVRIVNASDHSYGAEFVGLSPSTEKFLVELYGSVNFRNF